MSGLQPYVRSCGVVVIRPLYRSVNLSTENVQDHSQDIQ